MKPQTVGHQLLLLEFQEKVCFIKSLKRWIKWTKINQKNYGI